MTDRIDVELGRLLEEATPGPWRVPEWGDAGEVWGGGAPGSGSEYCLLVAHAFNRRDGVDCALAAALRNHAPALLDVVRMTRRLTAPCETRLAAGLRCVDTGATRGAWCRPCFTRPTLSEVAESVSRLDAGGDDGEQ